MCVSSGRATFEYLLTLVRENEYIEYLSYEFAIIFASKDSVKFLESM